MLSIEAAVTFFSASLLLALAPGPDNLFVLLQSALHGRAAGLVVTLGLCTGLLGHSAAVALGLAAVFQTSAAAFAVLKYVGAGYLLYLAWQAFSKDALHSTGEAARDVGLGMLYRRGVIMNLTNPKVSLFFLAFLPQFVDPKRGAVAPQIAVLGGLFIVATVVVFGGIALAAGTLRTHLTRSDRVQILLNRVAGVVFVGLACKLALAKR